MPKHTLNVSYLAKTASVLRQNSNRCLPNVYPVKFVAAVFSVPPLAHPARRTTGLAATANRWALPHPPPIFAWPLPSALSCCLAMTLFAPENV